MDRTKLREILIHFSSRRKFSFSLPEFPLLLLCPSFRLHLFEFFNIITKHFLFMIHIL